ncbi:MAG: zf-HC2 domain-containing protein [Kofleriaceae bacterium]
MNCATCQRLLSAYLDGALGDRDASALRGHLRTCEACRAQAALEASVIDTLHQLPPVEPPPGLWLAVREQLAQEEIADAGVPWHRRLARSLAPWAPRALGGVALAAAALALWHSRAPEPRGEALAIEGEAPRAAPAIVDVSLALVEESSMIDSSYRDAVSELVALIGETRVEWQPSYTEKYDARVVELRAQVDAAASGPARERAWQELMRFLQATLTRPELAMEVAP